MKKNGRPRVPLRDRAFPKLVITEAPFEKDRLGRPLVGPCLIWTGHLHRGYGSIWDPDRGQTGGNVRVHRLLYEMFVGPIADQIDHLCRVTACASPAHLEDVTGAENVARADHHTGPLGPISNPKTHCLNGHEFNAENTRLEARSDGRRSFARKCRICDNERAKKRRLARSGGVSRHNRDKVQCPSGHPYTEENTYRNSKGRYCRECGREATRRYMAKLREARLASE